MKRLIINADDFGLCRGVNLGIMHAFQQGIVTSTTLMVNMPAADEAFALAREHPTLGVGVHINLTAGVPLAGDVTSLTGPTGLFLKMPELLESAHPDHVRREVEAQVAAFLASGLRPTHLDSHHHVHQEMPVAREAIERVANRLGIPVRQFGPRFSSAFYGQNAISSEQLITLVEHLPDDLCEVMCHPAYVDPDLMRLSTYRLERVLELAALTDGKVYRALDASGITLVNYRGEEKEVPHG